MCGCCDVAGYAVLTKVKAWMESDDRENCMRETMSVDACYVIFTLCKLSLSPADSGNIVPLVYEVVVGVVGSFRHWSIN